jgi:hypothetical protein
MTRGAEAGAWASPAGNRARQVRTAVLGDNLGTADLDRRANAKSRPGPKIVGFRPILTRQSLPRRDSGSAARGSGKRAFVPDRSMKDLRSGWTLPFSPVEQQRGRALSRRDRFADRQPGALTPRSLVETGSKPLTLRQSEDAPGSRAGSLLNRSRLASRANLHGACPNRPCAAWTKSVRGDHRPECVNPVD